MSDPQFDHWRVILDLAAQHKTKGPLRQAIIAAGINIESETPISGFFRKKRSTGEVDPVGIWMKDGELVVLWGNDPVSHLHQVWPGCVWNPVPRAWYVAKLKGEEWPDVHDFKEMPDGSDKEAEPGPGHNSGATVSEIDALRGEIAEAKGGLSKYVRINKSVQPHTLQSLINSDLQRDASQSLRSKLLGFSRQAKQTRDGLNAPLKRQIDQNNALWKPLEDDAKAAADAVRFAQEDWGTRKLQAQRAEEAKAEEARVEHEQQQEMLALEAEAAVERGEPMPEPTFIAPPTAPEPERTAPQTAFRGGVGRAAHERAVKIIEEKDVTDWSAFLAYFVNDPSVRAEALKRANSILKSHGDTPPGCTPREVAKVA